MMSCYNKPVHTEAIPFFHPATKAAILCPLLFAVIQPRLVFHYSWFIVVWLLWKRAKFFSSKICIVGNHNPLLRIWTQKPTECYYQLISGLLKPWVTYPAWQRRHSEMCCFCLVVAPFTSVLYLKEFFLQFRLVSFIWLQVSWWDVVPQSLAQKRDCVKLWLHLIAPSIMWSVF